MKTNKFLHYFAMILLSYVLGISLSAQETYMFLGEKKVAPVTCNDCVKIYRVNLMQPDNLFQETKYDDLVVSINMNRFVHPPGLVNSHIMATCQFSADRTQIYFAEADGNLFRYTIANDSLEFIVDLIPDSLGRPLGLMTMIWENDSTLFFGGEFFGTYNVYTGEHTISQSYHNDWDIVPVSMVNYKGKYIFTSLYRTLVELDVENPKNSKILYDYSGLSLFWIPSLMLYQLDCDSVALCITFDKNFNNPWYKIDIDNNEYSLDKLTPIEELGAAPVHQIEWGYNFVNYYENCLIIDLDIDDSTVSGNGFLIDNLCYHSNIPISDNDIKISNLNDLDSVTIQIKNPSLLQYIGIPQGNYDIIRPNTPNITLKNNGNTTNEDFKKAIIEARYFDTGEEKGGTVEVQILGWYNNESTDTARAYINIIEQLPQAGEDIYEEYCQEKGKAIDLYSLLDTEISKNGNFVDTDLNEITGELNISETGIFKGFYILNTGVCSDTALFEIIINDIPDILPVKDTSMCYGSTYEVDLSYLNSDIEWSDGVKNKIRVIETAGDYIYKVTDEHGCYASDTFLVFVSEQPTITPIEATVCEGEPFYFLGKEYYEVGEYADTLKDINGCDSAYFKINLEHFERSEIVLTGNMGFCEGESTTLTIESEHRDLKLDGEDVQNTIEISSPGSYLLTGYDNNNCPSELRFEVSEYPNPQIFAEDIVDAKFSEPIKIPVDYSEGVVSYTWTPRSGLDCYDCPFPNITEPQDVIYIVEVTDKNGCISTQNINVSFKQIEYHIPNAIFNKPVHTDNGIFYVKSNVSFNYDLEIYDRWGNVLYRAENIRTNDASAGWSPEGEVNSGVFVYKIEFIEHGKRKIMAGDVTVL